MRSGVITSWRKEAGNSAIIKTGGRVKWAGGYLYHDRNLEHGALVSAAGVGGSAAKIL